MSFQNPKDFKKCNQCSFPMRPRGTFKKDFPDITTRAWGHSGSCKSCIQPSSSRNPQTTPEETEEPMAMHDDELGYDDEDLEGFHDPAYRQRKVPPEVRIANTVSGLEAFMARRHQRVKPEAVSPIVWGREEQKAA